MTEHGARQVEAIVRAFTLALHGAYREHRIAINAADEKLNIDIDHATHDRDVKIKGVFKEGKD